MKVLHAESLHTLQILLALSSSILSTFVSKICAHEVDIKLKLRNLKFCLAASDHDCFPTALQYFLHPRSMLLRQQQQSKNLQSIKFYLKGCFF